MPGERYREYMQNIRAANVLSAIQDEKEFRFGISNWGFAAKGWRLAYVYRTSPPDQSLLIDTMDGFRPDGKRGKMGYRPLAENWYAWIIW